MIFKRNSIAYLVVLISLLINFTVFSMPIAVGSKHGALIDGEGNVWVWGNNTAGQLGLGDFEDRLEPTQIPTLNNIVSIYAHGQTTFAIDKNGNVWAFGSNSDKVLGLENFNCNYPWPTKIEELSNIKTIIPKDSYTFALDNDGGVWAWGYNQQRHLGIRNEFDYSSPVKIEGLEPIELLINSSIYTLALAKNGSVWGWNGVHNFDANPFGYFLYTNSLSPSRFETLKNKNIVSLHIGINDCFALDGNGEVWTWNLEDFSRAKKNKIPTKIKTLEGKKIESLFISSSNYYAFEDNGNVWALEKTFNTFNANVANIEGLESTNSLSFIECSSLIYAVDTEGFVYIFKKGVLTPRRNRIDMDGMSRFISSIERMNGVGRLIKSELNAPPQIPEFGSIKIIVHNYKYAYLVDNNGHVWILEHNSVHNGHGIGKCDARISPMWSEQLSRLLQYTSRIIRTKKAVPFNEPIQEIAENLEDKFHDEQDSSLKSFEKDSTCRLL